MSETNVDVIVQAGDQNFSQTYSLTSNRFELQRTDELPAEFTGFIIDQDKKKDVRTYQRPSSSKLECILLDYSFQAFPSTRMKLFWLADSRPDCWFEILQLAQVTADLFEPQKQLCIQK